jgi:hypothetical protein
MADLYYVITNVEVDEKGDLLRREPPRACPERAGLKAKVSQPSWRCR